MHPESGESPATRSLIDASQLLAAFTLMTGIQSVPLHQQLGILIDVEFSHFLSDQ